MEVNGFVSLEAGRLREAITGALVAREQRIEKTREDGIVELMAEPRTRWSWRRLRRVYYRLTRAEALLEMRKRRPFEWSRWDEPAMEALNSYKAIQEVLDAMVGLDDSDEVLVSTRVAASLQKRLAISD